MILLSRVPYPLEKGDKLRAWHQIRHLSQRYDIILCCLNDGRLHPEAIANLQPFCHTIEIISLNRLAIVRNLIANVFSDRPFQVAYFYHRSAQKRIDKLVEQHLPKHILCQLVRVTEYVKKYSVIPKTLDYMDALSKGLERRMQRAPFYTKPLLRMEWQRLKRYERTIFDCFEGKAIISDQDRMLIDHPSHQRIQVIANGVDTDFFRPQKLDKEVDVVFTGNMSYPPNVETACYLAQEVMPLVWQNRPQTTLLISGANPSPKVRKLATDRVQISGWVEDIRESYARARVFAAPMLIGTGLQNKLLEAMAMQLPCITSSLANNALGAKPGEQVLIADDAADCAQHIVALLNNPSLSSAVSLAGHTFALNQFDWKKKTAELEQLMQL